MGTGSSSHRRYTYEQYYDALKQQHGGSMQNVHLNLDLSQIDPYEILGVTVQSSWDDLKRAYRKTALKVHTDKGGSDELFQLVTECFRKVAYEYKMRISDRPHHELKADAEQFYADRPVMSRNEMENSDFHTRFNHAFEKNRLDDDDHERGYADMMMASDPKRPDVAIERKMNGYNSDRFHQLFEKEVPVRKDLVVYKEPEPLIMAKKLAFTELGGKTEDFSSTGEGSEKRNLQYTDYMKAHTTSRLVDASLIKKRPEYRNVEEYEAARSKVVAKPMSKKEQDRLDRLKQKEEMAELERLRRLRERDDAIARHHERVTQLQLSAFANK
jgi:curved DNA-binding protein CbpA